MQTIEKTDDAVETMDGEAAVRFEDLGLSSEVLAAVRDMGYELPTPVQAATIPEVLAGRDVLAAAQTGTGKTAAFLLPVMSTLEHVVPLGNARDRRRARGRGPAMLIVTPTRELAQQIEDVCKHVAARTRHIAVTVVGGVGYNPQRSALKAGCDILVSTPGRLVDLIGEGTAKLSEVSVLVLDEADRMLDMGFLPDVRKIVAQTPADRQTLLFSATLDEKAVGSITDLVHNPARVEIAPPASTADTVDQYVVPVSSEVKNGMLVQVLKREGAQRVIVFTRTKHRADACCRRLARAGIKVAPIHGNRSQAQRERALADFRSGKVDVLVATDVLARGIDISDVRYVVNFDVPSEPTDYIHRIGRTGRAGEVGWALTFVTELDVNEFFDIEALMGKTAEFYDYGTLDLGAQPPVIDENRVPGKLTKKKAHRGKSTSKRKRRAPSAKRGEASQAHETPRGKAPQVDAAPRRAKKAADDAAAKRERQDGRSKRDDQGALHATAAKRADRAAMPAAEKRRNRAGASSKRNKGAAPAAAAKGGACLNANAPKSRSNAPKPRRRPGDLGGRR